jgi:hypothetical protein
VRRGKWLITGEVIQTHRYKLGARVRLTLGCRLGKAAEGPYEVLRQLPLSSDGEDQYRIKNADEEHERAVKESDLERAF